MTFCRRCGRVLKRRDSILRQYGGTCWRIVNGTQPKRTRPLRTGGGWKHWSAKSLLEVFGPTTSDVIKLEDVEPRFSQVASEAERIHRKAITKSDEQIL